MTADSKLQVSATPEVSNAMESDRLLKEIGEIIKTATAAADTANKSAKDIAESRQQIAAVLTEAHGRQKGLEGCAVGLAHREFDELDTSHDGRGWQGGQIRDGPAKMPARLVEQGQQRTVPIQRYRTRRPGTEAVVEDLEREMAPVAGCLQRRHEAHKIEVALARHAAPVTAP